MRQQSVLNVNARGTVLVTERQRVERDWSRIRRVSGVLGISGSERLDIEARSRINLPGRSVSFYPIPGQSANLALESVPQSVAMAVRKRSYNHFAAFARWLIVIQSVLWLPITAFMFVGGSAGVGTSVTFVIAAGAGLWAGMGLRSMTDVRRFVGILLCSLGLVVAALLLFVPVRNRFSLDTLPWSVLLIADIASLWGLTIGSLSPPIATTGPRMAETPS